MKVGEILLLKGQVGPDYLKLFSSKEGETAGTTNSNTVLCVVIFENKGPEETETL